jgi:cobalt-zinc-cadmium efflux system outer membrane protein
MRNSSFYLGAALVAHLATAVCAGEKLTLDQALTLAEEYHPLLRAGMAQIEGAQAGFTTARAYPRPLVSLIAGRQTIRVPGNVSGYTQFMTFSQELELGRLRPARLGLAQRGRETSEFLLAGTRIGVLNSVRRAFFEVLRRRQEIAILEENLRLVEDLRKRIAVQVEAGEAGRLELVRADAEVSIARTASNSARLQHISAMGQFRASIGSELAPELELEGQLEEAVSLPPLEELRRQALAEHPSLQYMRAEIRRSEARVDYEIAQRRPQPVVIAEIERPPDSPSYRVGLAVPLPFWNRREGPIAEANAQLRQSSSLARSRELEFLAALEGAYGRYNLARQQLAAFESGLLQQATEAVRAAEVAYRLGERGIIEVLDAQRVLRTVRLDQLNARFQLQSAWIDLNELRATDLQRPIP